MTPPKGVTDDQLGQYHRRTAAIAERLGKSLPFDGVMTALQQIHDGSLGTARLLEPVPTIVVPPSKRFVVRDQFNSSALKKAGIPFSGLTDDFAHRFLDKIEPPCPETRLVASYLQEDVQVELVELELRVRGSTTTLAQIHYLLKRHTANKKTSALGVANVFFVRDAEGAPCLVYVEFEASSRWPSGWEFNTGSTRRDKYATFLLSAGTRVFILGKP